MHIYGLLFAGGLRGRCSADPYAPRPVLMLRQILLFRGSNLIGNRPPIAQMSSQRRSIDAADPFITVTGRYIFSFGEGQDDDQNNRSDRTISFQRRHGLSEDLPAQCSHW